MLRFNTVKKLQFVAYGANIVNVLLSEIWSIS